MKNILVVLLLSSIVSVASAEGDVPYRVDTLVGHAYEGKTFAELSDSDQINMLALTIESLLKIMEEDELEHRRIERILQREVDDLHKVIELLFDIVCGKDSLDNIVAKTSEEKIEEVYNRCRLNGPDDPQSRPHRIIP